MDQKPKIPTLKDSQKPQVRIKGLAARLSLVERLKQFKKKDLAFILAGLGVLFMAPLAEHFMMSPENADSGSFKPGWGFQAQGFGGGGSPYESGVNGMAPGGQIGGGGDVITPLNVRDPSALIMGPGASQQPAATSTTPPPPAKENTDWKDAIANAASKGAAAATKAASLPVPKTSLTNAGLRGLGVASGSGGGASWTPPPISASHAPNSATPSNSLGRVTTPPGYMGVGSRSGQNGNAGSLEDLKRRAGLAGSDVNRQGSAASNAETAAGRGMGSGDGNGGSGQGMSDKEGKGGSGNSGKDSKSLGESLAFLAAKENQQKAIDLFWKLKEKDAMLWPDLKQKLLEEAVMTPFKSLTAGISDAIKDFGGDKNSYVYNCAEKKGIPAGAVADSCGKDTKGMCYDKVSKGIYNILIPGQSPGNPIYTACSKEKGAGDAQPSAAEVTPANQQLSGIGTGQDKELDSICTALGAATDTTDIKKKMVEAAQGLAAMKKALVTGADTPSCQSLGATTLPIQGLPATGTMKQALQTAMAPVVGPAAPNMLANANTALTAGFQAVAFTPEADGKAKITAADKAAWDAAWKAYDDGANKAAGDQPGQIAGTKTKLTQIAAQVASLKDIQTKVQGDITGLQGSGVQFPAGGNGPTQVSQMASYLGNYQGPLTNLDSSVKALQGQMNADGIIPKFNTDMQTLKGNIDAFRDGGTLQAVGSGGVPSSPETIKGYNDKMTTPPPDTPSSDQTTAATNVKATRDFIKQQAGSAGLGKSSADSLAAVNANLGSSPPAGAAK